MWHFAIQTPVILVPSLQEFFKDSVEAAMASNHTIVEEHTTHYLVTLLTFFARSEAMDKGSEHDFSTRPLALMLMDALASEPGYARNCALQRMGDVALFLAGFMAESLEAKPGHINYCMRMGGGAYHSLAGALQSNPRGRMLAPVFTELGNRFVEVVDVLNEVRHTSANDQDVLRLYERWLTTGSQRSARLLWQLGIQPHSQAGSTREH